jgi:hypothetical protein
VYLRCKGDQVTTFRAVGKLGYQAWIEPVNIYRPYIPVKGQSPVPPSSYGPEAGVSATFVKKGAKPVERWDESGPIMMATFTCVDGKPVQDR